MKRKGFYALATAAMLVLAAGCGSKQGEENPNNQVTEEITPTEAPATPEPTATPAPTATPVPSNYMEANGIEVLGAGWHTCKGFVADEADENGNPIMELADREYSFEVTEEENEGGTKIIQVTLNAKPYVHENGGRSTFAMGGFVDLQTGKAFFPMDEKVAQTTLLKQGEKEYELQLSCEFEYPSVTHPYYTERYTLVCPSDYEDAGFYMTGYNFDWETFIERAGLWKKLNFIRHGDSDLLVFDVNKGLATEPEKKAADSAALAEENYFETHGFTTQGEGEYIWIGTVGVRKKNTETGYWETASVEETKIISTISITEESLKNGTKKIKWTFSDIVEMLSEDEGRVPSTRSGVVDKKTGLVYPLRTYDLAESYVLGKEGEEFSILVGAEFAEEELGGGKSRAEISYTVICPEKYNDTVFFLTGRPEIEEEDSYYSNEKEVYSLSEINYGECDILFFQ